MPLLTWAIVIVWARSTLALYLWVGDTGLNVWVNGSVFFYFWHPFGGGLCLVWCVGSAVAGWATAQRSGHHRMAMVVASALAQVPLALWWSRSVWLHLERFAEFPATYWVPISVQTGIVIVGMPAATLLAGLWRADEVWVRRPVY